MGCLLVLQLTWGPVCEGNQKQTVLIRDFDNLNVTSEKAKSLSFGGNQNDRSGISRLNFIQSLNEIGIQIKK